MGDYSKQVPEGFADTLTDECTVKRTAEGAVRDIFLSHGLEEVCTPTFEYLDVFHNGRTTLRQEEMFKLTDPKGRLLVIRPDMTVPIARMAATCMKTQLKPLKLFYISNVFRIKGPGAEDQREFTQAGVEFIGLSGAQADGECISIAIEALKAAGIDNFRIDIGQVEFLESIINETDISIPDKEYLRELIRNKNLAAITEFLNEKGINKELRDLLLSIPMLYGSTKDVLRRAREHPLKGRTAGVLEDIERAFEVIEEYGYEKHISVDLGMVRELPYYTGIIFKGFTRDLGYIICNGGRYDGLQGRYGEDLPSTGFALNINRVVQSLYNQNRTKTLKQKTFVLECCKDNRKKAIYVAQKLRAAGFYIDIYSSGNDTEDAMAYARAKDVKGIITLQEGSRLRIIEPGTGKSLTTSMPGMIARADFLEDRRRSISSWH